MTQTTLHVPSNFHLPELELDEKHKQKVQQMLDQTNQENAPFFWENGFSKSFDVPVDDGKIRVYHIKPKNIVSKRPLVFVPGWGGFKEHFHDYYKSLHNKAELYYVETREKNSSKLNKNAKMNMHQKAKDIQDVINYFKLKNKDFILHGTCWGSAIILQGLIENSLEAPTIIAHDPMHTLWFPKWILKYVAPVLPTFLVKLMKPFFQWMQLRGMKEKVQRERAEYFIKYADVGKWKKTAIAVKDFELFGNLSGIEKTVFVTNGTVDKVHEQLNYPKIAKELPNGRFIYMETDEAQREKLMGLIAFEFSKISMDEDIPQSLKEFEKDLDSNKE